MTKTSFSALVSALLLAACTTPPQYSVSDGTRLDRATAEARHAAADPQVSPGTKIDTPCRVLKSRFPDYPEALRRAGIEGHVTLVFWVEADGSVTQPVVRGRPPAQLAALSLEALRDWRFEPARKDGLPVRVSVQQSFSFVLE